MHSSDARRRTQLVEGLRAAGVTDKQVLDAIHAVERHRFVPQELQSRAYENAALPIGQGQTISQPLVIALSIETLALTPESRVLEIGTGSGYQTALLARIAGKVHTVERLPLLLTQARDAMEALDGLDFDVEFHLADGSRGWPDAAPYDGIVVSASVPVVPQPLFEQVAPGGRLVAPTGTRDEQTLRVWRRRDAPGNELTEREICRVRFVPLVGEHGWRE